MKILISEDNLYKYEAIKKIVEKTFPGCEISHQTGVNPTIIDLVSNNDYDVLIQDMQLPRYDMFEEDGQNVLYNGGIEVLMRVSLRELKINKKIIVSSENQRHLLNENGLENIECIVYGYKGWEEELENFLKS